MLQYNVPGGKKNRGLALVVSYKQLEDPKNLTPENIRLANIMGWCVEMVKFFFFAKFNHSLNSGKFNFLFITVPSFLASVG